MTPIEAGMNEAKAVVPNAIVFVLDPSNKGAVVPEYAPGNTVAATESCVSIAALAEVDGPTTVRLGTPLSESERLGCVELFEGVVQTPGNRLAIVTSHLERLLEVQVAAATARIAVYADDPRSAGMICVSVW